MEFDISKVGFGYIANFSTKAQATEAAKRAGFGEPRKVYTRFTMAWIVGKWQSEQRPDMPDHLIVLTKSGERASLRISNGKSCHGTLNSLLLND